MSSNVSISEDVFVDALSHVNSEVDGENDMTRIPSNLINEISDKMVEVALVSDNEDQESTVDIDDVTPETTEISPSKTDCALMPSLTNTPFPVTPTKPSKQRSRPDMRIVIPSSDNNNSPPSLQKSSRVVVSDLSADISGMVNVALEDEDQVITGPDGKKKKWSLKLFKSEKKKQKEPNKSLSVFEPSECQITLNNENSLEPDLTPRINLISKEELESMSVSDLLETRDNLLKKIQDLSTCLIDTLEAREVASMQNANFKSKVAVILQNSLKSKKFKGKTKKLAMNVNIGSYYKNQ